MEYFGTDLKECGHYRWLLSDNQMKRIGLKFYDLSFNPETLTENLPNGHNAFYQTEKVSVLAISGSCIDNRQGCKSVFWVNESLSKQKLISRIKENKMAIKIISAMRFNVVDF